MEKKIKSPAQSQSVSFSPPSAILKIAKTLGTSLFRTDPVPSGFAKIRPFCKRVCHRKEIRVLSFFLRSNLFTGAKVLCQLCFHSTCRQSYCQVPEVLFNIHQTTKTYDFLAQRKGLNSIYMTSICTEDSLVNNFILF